MTAPASSARGDNQGGAAAPPLGVPRPAGAPGAQARRGPGTSVGPARAVSDSPAPFVTPFLSVK